MRQPSWAHMCLIQSYPLDSWKQKSIGDDWSGSVADKLLGAADASWGGRQQDATSYMKEASFQEGPTGSASVDGQRIVVRASS